MIDGVAERDVLVVLRRVKRLRVHSHQAGYDFILALDVATLLISRGIEGEAAFHLVEMWMDETRLHEEIRARSILSSLVPRLPA